MSTNKLQTQPSFKQEGRVQWHVIVRFTCITLPLRIQGHQGVLIQNLGSNSLTVSWFRIYVHILLCLVAEWQGDQSKQGNISTSLGGDKHIEQDIYMWGPVNLLPWCTDVCLILIHLSGITHCWCLFLSISILGSFWHHTWVPHLDTLGPFEALEHPTVKYQLPGTHTGLLCKTGLFGKSWWGLTTPLLD